MQSVEGVAFTSMQGRWRWLGVSGGWAEGETGEDEGVSGVLG